MSANLNQCVFIGNLTRDPELRVTENDNQLCKFTLAVSSRFSKDKQETLFMDCTAWGKPAEIIAKYVSKGQPLCVTGRLQSRKVGEKLYYTLKVDQFQFLAPSKGGAKVSADTPLPEANDDIPF